MPGGGGDADGVGNGRYPRRRLGGGDLGMGQQCTEMDFQPRHGEPRQLRNAPDIHQRGGLVRVHFRNLDQELPASQGAGVAPGGAIRSGFAVASVVSPRPSQSRED